MILDPKRESEKSTGRASWYPYYAGFSETFASRLLASANMDLSSAVGDPWNGSGTTTAAASGLGHNAFGYDLNPVMVIAARARMLSKRVKGSLVPLGKAIIKEAEFKSAAQSDPLAIWFMPQAVEFLRGLEQSIQRTLMNVDTPFSLIDGDRVQYVSDLAAFFYIAHFRTTRTLLQRFDATNPTWLKKPTSPAHRLRPSLNDVIDVFGDQVKAMATALDSDPITNRDSSVNISVGSSNCLPLPKESLDFILSSPPYCTRIDYAVATQAELAILGFRSETEFDSLRRQLIGSSTVPTVAPRPNPKWGYHCNSFLQKVAEHKSKASSGYYLKNHLQYFDSIFRSIEEIARTLTRGGTCALVVQDSYYKDVHNDLSKIVVEMAEQQGLRTTRQEAFRHRRSMAGVNPQVRKYRSHVDAIESVLCFSKD